MDVDLEALQHLNTYQVQTSYANIAVIESQASRASALNPVVLFIHGNSSCKAVFAHQLLGEVGEKYRCIAIDLPGHGDSGDATSPEHTYTIPAYATMILELMAKIEVNQFVIVGWSLGGHIGIELIAQSSQILGLLISGTPPVGHDANDMASAFLPTPHMALTGQAIFTQIDIDNYTRATCGEPVDFLRAAVARTDGRSRSSMMAAAMQGLGADQKEVVQTNNTPLAVINGKNDPMISHAYLESLNYQHLWREQVFQIEAAGHAPFWQQPDRFDPLLLNFLTSI